MTRLSQFKITLLSAPIVGGIFGAGFTFKQQLFLDPVTVSHTYKQADFGSIDLRGACSVSQNSVSCWDASGKPDADLTETIKAYYIVNPNSDIPIRPGRKNRLVVFTRPGFAFQHGVYMNYPRTPEGGFVGTLGNLARGGNDPCLEWYGLAADLAAKTGAIMFDVNKGLGTLNVPLKEGAEGQMGTFKVHINSIAQGAYRTWNRPGGTQKTWTVSIGITGYSGNDQPNMNGSVLDLKGVKINRVDAIGNPIPTRTAAQGNNYQQPMTGFDAQLQITGRPGPSMQDLMLPVNPSKVSALSFTPIAVRRVTITDIPLDPR